MTRFSILTLALVASSTAFAVGRPAAAANPPAGAAATVVTTVKACVAVNPAGKSKAWGTEKCLDAAGTETTRAAFEVVSWHADASTGHYGCGATEAEHATNAWDSLTGACEDAKTAGRDRKIATRSYVDASLAVDHGVTVAMTEKLGMHEVESIDGTGVVSKVWVSDTLAKLEANDTAADSRLTAAEGRLTAIEVKDGEQDTAIAAAQTKAEDVEKALGFKVDLEVYKADVVTQAGIDSRQDKTAKEQGEKIATLWNGAHFTGFLAPAFVFLDGGTPITVDDSSDQFAGEKLAFGQRGAFGVAGGFGGEWQWGGVMATGSVGVMGEAGNQVGMVGVVAYYPFHASQEVQIDFGLEGSYLEAGDRFFNTTYAGSTSKLSGFGAGPSLAVGVGGGPTKLDIRAALLLGGVNQELPFAIDDTGDGVLENQNATAFVLSVGGRFGGAPRE